MTCATAMADKNMFRDDVIPATSQPWWGSGRGGMAPASTIGNQAFEAQAALSPR